MSEVHKIPEKLSANDCAERAIEYAAIAAFRASEREGAQEAADILMAIKSTLGGMWLDFARIAEKAKKSSS